MTMWILIAAAQATVNVPAVAPAGDTVSPADPARLSLVVADTVSETDPQKLCDLPDCTSLFLGRYRGAVVLAGLPLDPDFVARVEMGSPWNMSYRLAMVVEQREGKEPLVRAMAGFNERTGEACFDADAMARLAWRPEGAKIVSRRGSLCIER